jgi:hypothetical protein
MASVVRSGRFSGTKCLPTATSSTNITDSSLARHERSDACLPQRSQRSQLATFTSAEVTTDGLRQGPDLRFCVELRGIEPLTSSMPCTRRTVQHVQPRPVEATRVRSYPTAVQRRSRAGKTSSVQCVPTRPSASLPVPPRPNDRQWLRCWLRRRDPSAACRVPAQAPAGPASGSANVITASRTSPKSKGSPTPSTPSAVRYAR